jgi:hypothetical protein
MRFEIQWTGHQGAAMTHRDTAAEAIRFAIEMLGKTSPTLSLLTLTKAARLTGHLNLSGFTRMRSCDDAAGLQSEKDLRPSARYGSALRQARKSVHGQD